MPLNQGKKLGPYEIVEPLGAGGNYDVSSDGQRFLVNTLVKQKTSSLGVTVVTNWTGILDPCP